MSLKLEPHPLLLPACFATHLPRPLGELASPEWLTALLRPDSTAPVARAEEIRLEVRNLLRHGGYRPTGRGKPSSEYLVRAADEGRLASINLCVDACNAASYHSGLPISVVDLDRAAEPLRIAPGAEGASYAFNPSGQVISVAGLPCLHDAEGPCANAVKDAQRTKTGPETLRTLSIVWGTRALPEAVLTEAVAWYRELLERAGASTEAVPVA